jgi:Icc-related predicted phosphoesterase
MTCTPIRRSANAASGYQDPMTQTLRVAAAGDVHAVEPLRERLTRAFAAAADDCDLILLAGDLTTHGLPEQAAVLADACRGVTVPVIAVLGNHDHHSGRADEVTAELERGGLVVLDRGHTVLEIGEVEVGIVGTKGFVGGFPGAEIPDFGEPALRQIYRETSAEVDALEEGLEAVAGCHKRIVLLHYAPISDTIVGEPEGIWAFLGSGRLAGPIGMHRPELVVHGHAHHGQAKGSIGTVPVYNVAVHVTGQDFVDFTI